jgi:hypothetical protein
MVIVTDYEQTMRRFLQQNVTSRVRSVYTSVKRRALIDEPDKPITTNASVTLSETHRG